MKKFAKLLVVAIGVLSVSAFAATQGEKILKSKVDVKRKSFKQARPATQDWKARKQV